MPKNIPPESGVSSEVAFDQILKELGSPRQGLVNSPNQLRNTINRIKGFVNPGVCFTPSQVKGTTIVIAAPLNHTQELGEIKSLELATSINSFNLECSNCLNTDCPQRELSK